MASVTPFAGEAKAHFPQLAVSAVEEDPLLRTARPYDQIEPVPVGIATRLFCRLDLPRREKVLLALPSPVMTVPADLPQHLPQLKSRIGANVNERVRASIASMPRI